MNANETIIVRIRPRRITRLRDGKHRRLAMERLEYRWLLSGAAGTTDWPAAESAWPASAPAAVSTTTFASADKWPQAAPASASATTRPAAVTAASLPAAATAAPLPAAASNADCDGQGGWVDVGPTGSGSSDSGSEYQTNPSSSWSSSGADQLPAKKPGLLVLSPDELRANSAGEGGLADLTRIPNQPVTALIAAASPGETAERNADGTARRPLSGAAGQAESSLTGLPSVKLDGLRGTSQAFDVAMTPMQPRAGGSSVEDAGADLRFHPATVWPMPALPRMQLEGGGSPASSALPNGAPLPGEGKTTFLPVNQSVVVPHDLFAASAGAEQTADELASASASATEGDAKKLNGKAHDRVLSHVADFVHNLSLAARLNDRRVEAAVVAVLAAVPYRRFRKRQDTEI